MPSGLVIRYAKLCNKPLIEVERQWRHCKTESTQQGKKSQWDVSVKKLRERLGVQSNEGRVVFLDGLYESIVLSETPSCLLVQVQNIESTSEDLKECLTKSLGVITTTYDRISHSIGAEPIQYSLSEDTGSLAVGSSASVAPQASLYLIAGLKIAYKGKKGKVLQSDKETSTIELVDGTTMNVKNAEITVESCFTPESINRLWKDIKNNDCIVESEKINTLREVIKFENHISFIPNSLIETIVEKLSELDKKYQVTQDDWDIIEDKDITANSDVDVKKELPMPEEPVERMGGPSEGHIKSLEDVEDDYMEGIVSRKPTETSTEQSKGRGVRTPSTGEVNKLSRHIRGESVNLRQMSDSADQYAKFHRGQGQVLNESSEERLERAVNTWTDLGFFDK